MSVIRPNRTQFEADELFIKINQNKELLDELTAAHGHCIRVFVTKESDTWLFEDQFKYVVKKESSN